MPLRLLRFDSVGGASGDMILSTLAALGADLDAVAQVLHAIIPDTFAVRDATVTLNGIQGHRTTVDLDGHVHPAPSHTISQSEAACPPAHAEPHQSSANEGEAHAHTHAPTHPHTHTPSHTLPHGRNLPTIESLLLSGHLSPRVQQQALAVFRRLAEAEAHIHGTTPDKVHFHEVGAVDALVDIVGSCLALEQLAVEAVDVGPLPLGRGTMQCAHGVMPLPAPATAELLAGHAVETTDEPFELVTPTGAALLMTWQALLPSPAGTQTLLSTGFGFGQRTLAARPNLLRGTLINVQTADVPGDDAPVTDVRLLTCNLDDCPGEWVGDAIPRLLEAGALDVWTRAIGMKKGRPGVELNALCAPAALESVEEAIFRHTTTFGIRRQSLSRRVLNRHHDPVDTAYGNIRVKVGVLEGREITRSPEYEDCASAAARHGVSVREVYRAASKAE